MKTFLLSVLLCISIAPLSAQKLDPEDFQGKWKLVKYITEDATLDVTTGIATVSESVKKKGFEEYDKEVKENTEKLTENLRLAYLDIEGSKFVMLLDNTVRAGTYKVKKNKKNKQVVIAKFTDTSESNVAIIMNEGKIELTNTNTKDVYVFAKEE